MSNFLIYPLKTMRITQNYNGEASHRPYSTGTPKSFPVDDGASDGGRDWVCCPCDEVKVVRMSGVGNNYTNTIWITSTSKVVFADGTKAYATMNFIHPNDDDLRKIKLGQKFKRFDPMFREGTDGHASGNHVHFEVGKGTIKGDGWTTNSRGKLVLTTTEGPVKPEDAFSIDQSFTKRVANSKGLAFRTLEQVKSLLKGVKYVVNVDTLNVRKAPTTSSEKAAKLKRGQKITVKAMSTADGYTWGKCSKGWVALKFCKKV